MQINELLHRIQRRLLKLRLQPIRVFCFHQVSDVYDPLTMWKCDWTQTEIFKHNIMHLKTQGYQFISLQDAHKHLQKDIFRFHKYVVLTADDGYKSLLNILPWLKEQQIPITLFVNTKYLDGQSWSEINEVQAKRVKPNVDMFKDVCPKLYLSKSELLDVATYDNVTIGMHGHEHLDALRQTHEEFKNNLLRCEEELKYIPHTIPYFAYTWGRHQEGTDCLLMEEKITPLYISGNRNYINHIYIDRETFDGKQF